VTLWSVLYYAVPFSKACGPGMACVEQPRQKRDEGQTEGKQQGSLGWAQKAGDARIQ
jgi:hypothetical protein